MALSLQKKGPNHQPSTTMFDSGMRYSGTLIYKCPNKCVFRDTSLLFFAMTLELKFVYKPALDTPRLFGAVNATVNTATSAQHIVTHSFTLSI